MITYQEHNEMPPARQVNIKTRNSPKTTSIPILHKCAKRERSEKKAMHDNIMIIKNKQTR